MYKDFNEEYDSEEILLDYLRKLFGSFPKNKAYVINQTNFNRARKTIVEFLDTFRKEKFDFSYQISFDELLGTDLVLDVESHCFIFYENAEYTNIFSTAESVDIVVTAENKIRITFGFKDVLLLVGF